MLTATPLREQEEQLKLMALHLRAERGCLLIVATPDAEAERALAEEVRLRVGDEVAVEEVTLAATPVERLSLSHHLSTLPLPSGKAAVFIFGLDDLPPDARTTAINAMNWGRERLRWAGYSVVLWVRPGTPGELGNRAPDFFSWRSDVFEFDLPTNSAERQRVLAQLRLFAPATLDELRQRYCDYVVRTCQWLDFRGLLQLRNVVRLPLDEVFVPLEAVTSSDYVPLPRPTSEPSDVAEWWVYERYRTEQRVKLNDAVRQHQHFVVLGDPGSGKSTLLRYLALTFAQGKQWVQERLGLNEDRLPILVPLSAFAEAQQTRPDLSLAEFLPRYFTGQGLPDFSPLFDDALHSGRALILLDGLDEMLTYDDRAAVACAVAEFTNAYPTLHVIVTSRIAGYTAGMLPANFETLTLAPFDDPNIKRFAEQWSLAFEAVGLPPHAELPSDAHRRAMLRAESLAAAVTSHPGVRRLATNPLLLTLLALIHHQGTRLPHRRVDLYRLCVEALAETWNLARSLTGRPIDLRLGERRLDEELVVRILAPVAYWMHETKPTGLVERDELEARIAGQFIECEGISPDEAASLARDFVSLAREQMGLLVERAPNVFSFMHLSFQEYLVARFLSERKDGFEWLKPRLHHPRWREVVLLTAGCLRGDYAAAFVENILNAHGSFDNLLERAQALGQGGQGEAEVRNILLSIMDLLLAAHCISDGAPVSLTLRQQIRDTLFNLWRHPPFSRLRREITEAFVYLKGSVIGPEVLAFLLRILQDRNEDKWVRVNAADALGTVGQGEPEVEQVLGSIAQAASEDDWVQSHAKQALRQVRREEPEVSVLLHILRDKNEAEAVRAAVAMMLGEVEQKGRGVVQTLLSIVQDRSEARQVRMGAALALERLKENEAEGVETLRDLVRDRSEKGAVRRNATFALGQAEQGGTEVVEMLPNIVRDESEDEMVRLSAVLALGQVGRGEAEGVETLLNAAADPDLCDDALGALWDNLTWGEREGTPEE